MLPGHRPRPQGALQTASEATRPKRTADQEQSDDLRTEDGDTEHSLRGR